VVHGAGQLPSQAGPEPIARIDYIYAHIPKPYYTTVGRVFTSPIENIWMSDHYGLRGEIDLAGAIPNPLPSSDSNTHLLPAPTTLEVTAKNAATWPEKIDLTASAERGLDIKNSSHGLVEFDFQKKIKKVYTAAGGTLSNNEEMNFIFFEPGDYPFKMRVHLNDAFGTVVVTEGVVHVYEALKSSAPLQ
jgi:hypothetical protein